MTSILYLMQIFNISLWSDHVNNFNWGIKNFTFNSKVSKYDIAIKRSWLTIQKLRPLILIEKYLSDEFKQITAILTCSRISCPEVYFKELYVISIDPPCKDGKARFTTIPKVLSDQVFITHQFLYFLKWLFSIVVSLQKWIAHFHCKNI